MTEAIVEYNECADWFELTNEVGSFVLSPEEMKALVETALFAVARRMELTRQATV